MILDQNRSAALVSTRDLHKVVEKAVAAAGLRAISSKDLIVRWDLVGREMASLAEAEAFAHSIAKQVTAAGLAATHAVQTVGHTIVGGFFERSAVPQIREL